MRLLPISCVALLACALPAQALLVRDGGPVRVEVAGGSLADVIEKVVGGPDAAERRAGLRTAVPAGTRLLGVEVRGGRASITLGAPFLELLEDQGELELAIEQVAKSASFADPRLTAVDLSIADAAGAVRPLTAILQGGPSAAGPARPPNPPPPARTANEVQGALSGLRIAVSPSHGYYWHTTLGWTTQRPLIDGLTEDIHSNEIAMRYLIPYLENMGAEVISCREQGEITHERVADNDAGPPIYQDAGNWSTSASTGYNGGTYRWSPTRSPADSFATWTVPVPADGRYPVYAAYRAGANRATDAHYEIHHSGGVDDVHVDQTRDSLTWRFLGEFHFSQAGGAKIVLANDSPTIGRVVIADTIKVGGGVGSISRGGTTSGRPRWQEASRYWAQYAGAPSSVWNSISGGQDNSDDVTCRPRFAEWRGADAFVSVHTNAGGGTGTSSYIYNGGATPGSAAWQRSIHDRIIQDLRAHWYSGWVDRGKLQANFGEVRLLSTMPGVLLELAFHDTPGSRDHDALHDPNFRRIVARAIARGALHYFRPGIAFPPEPPVALRVTQDGNRGLEVAWDPTSGAQGYAIEQSGDGKGFVEVARVAAPTTRWSTGPLEPGAMLSFRVRAHNATGRSLPTEVLTAGTSHLGVADLLLVQGFDRLERTVKYPDNTFDYLPRHARAIRDADEFSLGFDAATNEAVSLSRVSLLGYRAVDWACGEESTRHETFDAREQALVTAYLAQGGRLLVTGSEIGWDLDARGSAADRVFYRQVIGARYLADDANTYGFRPAPVPGLFTGLPTGTFDDGRQGTYDVDYADVIGPATAFGRTDLVYSNGLGAGIVVDDPTRGARIVHLGFPLETIVSDGLRASITARALRFLLSPRALDTASAEAPIGAATPLDVDLPATPGRVYILAAALAVEPPIPLPGGGILPLAADGLFSISLDPRSPVFVGFQGLLDGQGRATARFVLPNLAILRGIDFYFSGFTLSQPNPPVLGEVLTWVRLRGS